MSLERRGDKSTARTAPRAEVAQQLPKINPA